MNNLTTHFPYHIPKIRREILVASITVFGLLSTGLVIVNDLSGSQFEVIEYVLKNVDDSNTTILASPIYSWIFLAYDKENVLLDYSQIMFYPIETEKVMLIVDEHFLIDIGRGKELSEIYNKTKTITSNWLPDKSFTITNPVLSKPKTVILTTRISLRIFGFCMRLTMFSSIIAPPIHKIGNIGIKWKYCLYPTDEVNNKKGINHNKTNQSFLIAE